MTENLSIVDGGALSTLTTATLGEALVRAAVLDDAGDIRYLSGDGTEQRQSYSDLLDDASRILSGIRAKGLVPGSLVVIQIDHAPDLIAAFWACVLGGYVPVPVSANPPPNSALSAAELLAGVWGMLDEAWVITDAPPADGARFAPAWLGEVGALRDNDPARDWHISDADELAVLLLTSGSTGLPKAVMLTHRNIMSRSQASAQVRGLGVANRTFNWMPLDHIGGLVMFHVRDVFLGCHQVHARTEWVIEDPLRWLDAMSRYGSDTTWAPNFAFGLVVDRAEEIATRSWDLSALGYIMNGGEAIKPRVGRLFLEILAPFGLPATSMHPGWGMSETSAGVVDRVFSVETSSDDDRFVPVGVPHPGVSIRVVDEHGALVPECTVGRLQATGLPITSGYYGNPEQNRQSFTEDGWFKTGDLAFIEGGVLVVTGRVDDVVEIAGVTYHGHEIEASVEELPFVEPSYTIACTVDDDRLAIFFHPRANADVDRVVRLVAEHVRERFGVEVGHVVPVEKDEVPKTGIGKLKRSLLADRFAARS